MNIKDLSIVFMGTPEFAVTILEGIVKSGIKVVGVITAPDKPSGRGRKLSQSPVKTFSETHKLNLLQPTNLKDEEFQRDLAKLNADLFVVVAFRMLPESVWSIPPRGTINLHASILPQYRGAAPINWAIINGETETGVTTFFIEKEIDTGKIILFNKTSIDKNMTAGELHDKLAQIGVNTVIETLINLANNSIEPIDQNQFELDKLNKAPKIFKEDCQIKNKWTAQKTHDFVRGLSPYPGAFCKLEKNGIIYTCKIFNTTITDTKTKESFRMMVSDDGILFPCSDKYLLMKEIQLEGKRRMNYKDFLSGNDLSDFKIRY